VLLRDEHGQSRDQSGGSIVLAPETFQKIKRYFRFLSDGCQQEITLINDLLDLTRVDAETEPLNLLPLELSSFLSAIVQPFMERTQRQQQTLVVDLPPDLPLLDTEPVYLQRIVTELMNNAYKYTPPGETITLAARLEQQVPSPQALLTPSLLTQSLQPYVRLLILSVTNTGIEIPVSEHDRIFERFYRIPNSDPVYNSLAAGVAMSRRAQRLMA
jgi:signal transduction histidine kinase